MEMIGNARVVMLGEASHGTKEYYAWRSEITRRLIIEKGFSFMAVEGDWPECFEVNRFIKRPAIGENAEKILGGAYKRWPSWMWANEEVREFVEWLRSYNSSITRTRQFGFYGLDVYSLWESMERIISYLQKSEPQGLEQAYRAFACFEPYGKNAYEYAKSTPFVNGTCEEEVIRLLQEVRTEVTKRSDPREEMFSTEQNARVVQNAEKYYRTMMRADAESWNVRDRHMMETFERLLEYHGKDAKAVVWAHNTHIGDARATSMRDEGTLNIGELARKKFGNKCVLVGFGSYSGEVIAGQFWGSPMQIMPVPEARRGSWEHMFYAASVGDSFVLTKEIQKELQDVKRGHRAIGVVYDPEYEVGNYVPTYLTKRYDAFLYLEETSALEPLAIGKTAIEEIPETFPVGE
jgi:erythromycin esterase-like protein